MLTCMYVQWGEFHAPYTMANSRIPIHSFATAALLLFVEIPSPFYLNMSSLHNRTEDSGPCLMFGHKQHQQQQQQQWQSDSARVQTREKKHRTTNHRREYDVTRKIMKKIMAGEWIIRYGF